MGHMVQYFDYAETVDKRWVQAECDHFAAMEDWEEGCSGLYNDIRWIESAGILDSYEAAEKYISLHDRKHYDQLAVRYYSYHSPERSKGLQNAEEAVNKAERARFALEKSINAAFFARKSEFVGCKGCGSKLSFKYLKMTSTTVCPLCKQSLFSETDTKRLKRADNKVIEMGRRLTEANKKEQARAIKKFEKERTVRWLVKIEYHQ